ncbi:twin-arginine translocation signal domain-containing protein [Paraglaciecola aquimarina]|uniref:Twin-arginine translocation signal domain-containing protein n=1 Tax=Paraglaciecola aquimarina TaxID=1235557 RepID=A0ABU3SVI6_9ALTE|nr:twin-arginine translocation signal domain-containing protein [Paraglaciecola aquimarina]MDU0353993.1 twin-arginine translocation signal domain-containing protein [Paraglaciecola aquimarina]
MYKPELERRRFLQRLTAGALATTLASCSAPIAGHGLKALLDLFHAIR